jgi:hypothetical protein
MELVGERALPEPSPPPSTSPTTTTTTRLNQPELAREVVARGAWKQAVLGTLDVAIRVVAARLIVLVGTVGGIWLTWFALQEPDPYRLGALAIYGLGVFIPSVWLASR